MTIILGIIVEILTILGASLIAVKGSMDALLEIPKNGYKFNEDELEKYKEEYLQKQGKKGKILPKVMLFTPGINMLAMCIYSYKFKNSIMKDEDVKKVIVPMTNYEKNEYSKLDNNFERIMFTVGNLSHNNNTKIEPNTLILHNDSLSDVYTIDDVKKLNSVTKGTYRLGIVDGLHTAIIGIPAQDRVVKSVKFKDEDYKEKHEFVNITEDNSNDEIFVVYPFLRNHCDTELEECNREILDARKQVRKLPLIDRLAIIEPQTSLDYPKYEAVSDKVLVKNNGPYKHKR